VRKKILTNIVVQDLTSMEKKYQVFVSSTYKDLTEERQQVMQALLELDCIPVGMELFPAADDDQWTLIKRLIDDCDYYLVIVAGRYGSTHNDGVSYTQMEYEYALTKEIPIIGFIHGDPGSIASSKTDSDITLKTKLDSFKSLVQKKMVKHWTNPSDLGSQVSRSLVKLIKDKPQIGWVKASNILSEDSTKEILELRKEIDSLKQQINKNSSFAPEGTEDLSKGDDTIEITCIWQAKNSKYEALPDTFTVGVDLTWNMIFFEISPLMIDEANGDKLKEPLNALLRVNSFDLAELYIKEHRYNYLGSAFIQETDFQTIMIQCRALGLIAENTKKRSIHDKGTYWKLTSYGDTVMSRLRAVKKKK